jgi:hypothetical protein
VAPGSLKALVSRTFSVTAFVAGYYQSKIRGLSRTVLIFLQVNAKAHLHFSPF